MISNEQFVIHSLTHTHTIYDLKEPSAELVRKTIEKCGKPKSPIYSFFVLIR